MSEEEPFSTLYENRQDVLEHPELYTDEVTYFSAGGLGSCVYNQKITAAELVACWQFLEYHFLCPVCGQVSYITRWAGHANGGGYWAIHAYCPHCGKLNHWYRNTSPVVWHDVHWTTMRDIAKIVKEKLGEVSKER